MKKILTVFILSGIAISCSKNDNTYTPPPAHPVMKYTNLGNTPVKFGQLKTLDINGDNTVDLIFSTVTVGDPLYKRDKKRYYANGSFDVFSLVNEQEETPALNSGDSITIRNHAGYYWYNASSIILAEKIIEETGDPYWQGNWKNAGHKYFAVQVRKDNLFYNGWVEISFHTNTEELILHRAAIATEAGKGIIAGK